ncbi:MAG: hypothetical protein MUD08_08705, partial [Cytophagales bacterium]|nr:hypothetical protein [Cytophagales bacterium]
MKTILHFLALFFLLPAVAWATKPEPIEPKTKILQTADWYRQQTQLWKTEAERRPQNAAAWLNCYLAA